MVRGHRISGWWGGAARKWRKGEISSSHHGQSQQQAQEHRGPLWRAVRGMQRERDARTLMTLAPVLGSPAMNIETFPPVALRTSSDPRRAAPPALWAAGVLNISGIFPSSSRRPSLDTGQRERD